MNLRLTRQEGILVEKLRHTKLLFVRRMMLCVWCGTMACQLFSNMFGLELGGRVMLTGLLVGLMNVLAYRTICELFARVSKIFKSDIGFRN